jgi:peptidoglycan/LPS O-acetylase OafA/YrhL
LIVLGLAMSGIKNWTILEPIRTAISEVTPVAAPNLYQFQSQLAATALFIGTLLSPIAQHPLASQICRRLGRLSFGIYLVHFPILFTVACAAFLPLAATLPYPAAVTITGAGFALLVLTAASNFERWIDRPAIRFSRGLATHATTASGPP